MVRLKASPATVPPPAGDGLLVVDKPRGPTSHDLVAAVRRWLGRRDVGHAGTLDPLASGVLLVLIGDGTKLSAHLTLDCKRYRAEVELGRSTTTDDTEGQTVETSPLPPGGLEPELLAAALAAERARVLQVPPAYSAIQIGGRRAHRLSRAGAPPVLPARPVQVERLEVVAASSARLVLELTVSKGYYVRSLARDLGQRLGVPAHLAALTRVASGDFSLAEAVPWPPPPGTTLVSTAAVARRALPCAVLAPSGVARARQGQRLHAEDFTQPPAPGPVLAPAAAEPIVAWLGPAGDLVALGQQKGPDHFGVVRGFPDRSALP